MRQRDVVAVVLLVAAMAILTVGAVVHHDRAGLDVGVEVTNTTIQDESMTAMRVRLENNEPATTTVLVRVWGQKDHRQHIWATPAGDIRLRLRAGETRSVTLRRQQFNLSTTPSNPVMVVVATPDGVKRTHAIINATALSDRKSNVTHARGGRQ